MNAPTSRIAALALAALGFGCTNTPVYVPPAVPAPEVLHTTYRAISGVSMGGLGASMIGLHHPEQFDAVAALGGPMDADYLASHMIEHTLMAGFCSRQQLEAQLAIDPAKLNDPATMTCTADIPGTISTEHTESFNHWRFTTSGGHFDRSDYLNLFYDLTAAFGNLGSYNPDSAIAPQGVPESIVTNPPADICTNPFRIPGKLSSPDAQPIYNLEYNPEGKYDAITFCDGEEAPVYYCSTQKLEVDFCAVGHGAVVPRSQEASYAQAFCAGDSVSTADGTESDDAVVQIYLHAEGRFDPCREHTEPIRVATAFDYNGNGFRDFAEPVVDNSHERYDDVGQDGCADALEDGNGGCVTDPADSPFARGVADPNRDNFDILYNPFGTENDWKYEEGEPFRDDGLDGVPGTGDYGEGNGKYDETPGLARLHGYDPRANYLKMTTLQKHQMDLYLEGGIRDVFNFGVAAEVFSGAVRGSDPSRLAEFRDFASIFQVHNPITEVNSHGDQAEWDIAPPNTLELYGNPNANEAELLEGDGDHVGTDLQAVLRFEFMASWVANRWQALPLGTKPQANGDFSCDGITGRPCTPREFPSTYFSPALNATRDFSIYLPPGYFDPTQADQRYPVLYVLHGYGQDSTDLAPTTSVLFEPSMASLPSYCPLPNSRKYIAVFPSGRCCFDNPTTHERDCTLVHENDPAWVSTCNEGSFYVNASGTGAPPYEDGLLDLVQYVDAHYRTLPAADVTVR